MTGVAEEARVERGPQRRKAGKRSSRRPLILVVEDEKNDWEIYGKMLWYNGYDVLYAADGEAGLKLARESPPDLVVADLILPKLNGLELCVALKQDSRTRDIPVIMLTARARSEFEERSRKAGCALYLEKPTSPVTLLHEVEELIGRPPPAA
ncbi:MAG: response regulator [Longimicrobiales bacterium]